MRWWLAGGFAAIAVLTAGLTATLSSREVSRDVQENAREIAIGKTVSAAFDIERAIPQGRLRAQANASNIRFRLPLFVFARDGRLVAHASQGGVTWTSVPGGRRALASALAGRRVVASVGTATLVALPLRRTDAAGALGVARQVVAAVGDLDIRHGASPTSDHVTISVGVATTPVPGGLEESALIEAADAALYRAKAAGRNRVEVGHVRYRDVAGGVA